jgi:hypothetical protein
MTKNEGDSFTLRFSMYSEDRLPTTPTTARYKIECLTNKRNIRNWTTLTVAQEIDISIEPDDNVILTEGSRVERRQMTVQTDYGTTTQNVFTREWDVRNLQG